MKRGHNLRWGQIDGDIGRSLGGRKRARIWNHQPFEDDSNRTNAQFYGHYAYWLMVQKHGEEEARQILSERGIDTFSKQREEMDNYLSQTRQIESGERQYHDLPG